MLSILAASMVILATLIMYLEARNRLDMKVKNLNLDLEREVEERMKIEDKYNRVLTDFQKQEELKKARDVDEMQLLFTKVNILDDKITYFSTNTKAQLDGVLSEISKKSSSGADSDIDSIGNIIDEKLGKFLEDINSLNIEKSNNMPSSVENWNPSLPIVNEDNTIKTDVDSNMDFNTGIDFKENDLTNNEIPLTDINVLDDKYDNGSEENKTDETSSESQTDSNENQNTDDDNSTVDANIKNGSKDEKFEEFNAEDAMFKSSGDDNLEFFEENRAEEFPETKDPSIDNSVQPSVAVNENPIDTNVDEDDFMFNENESENSTVATESNIGNVEEVGGTEELGSVYNDAVDKMESLDKELSENDDYMSIEKPKTDDDNTDFDDMNSSGFDIKESIEKLKAQLADNK